MILDLYEIISKINLGNTQSISLLTDLYGIHCILQYKNIKVILY